MFWIGAAASLVSGAVVAADLALAKQFSVPGHPSQYHLGKFLLLLICQLSLIRLTFEPMMLVRPDRAIVTWMTNVSSGILAAFVLTNLAAGFGVLHGVALRWLPFLVQTLAAIGALMIVNRRLSEQHQRADWAQTLWARGMFTGFPAVGWVLYAVYCVGLGSVILGLLELNGLAEGLTIGLGGLAVLLGFGLEFRFLPAEQVDPLEVARYLEKERSQSIWPNRNEGVP